VVNTWLLFAFVKACHQDITTDALAAAAWPTGAQPPALTGDYATLPGELSVDVASEVQNLWSMSVLVGNQFSDQGPYDQKDISSIAELAARPELQREHCLRGPGDDGNEGDVSALAACKAFIMEQIGAALGDGDTPDLAVTETIRLVLVFRGDADVPLPRFAFHLGRATHALQDAFTHTFRTPDLRRVRTVLNWVDWLHAGTYDEARDGFQHVAALDQCGSGNEGGPERRAAALQATEELLAAVADDRGGRAGRIARASAVVDAWFGIEPGCNQSNDWCDAPERMQTGFLGCGVGGPARGGLLVLALLLALRRRRAAAGLALLLAAAPARAQEQQENPATGETKGGVIPKATPAEQRLLKSRPFGVLVKGGVAIDNAAFELGGGVRYDLGKRFTVGLQADWTPWFSLETSKSTAGTFNVYAVGLYRIDVRDFLELNATVSAGASVLLFNAWAAQSGSVGPYFAISPLGVGFKMGSRLRLLVDPAEFVIPIPQTRGIPLIYRQHRLSIALQSNF
jgi:hypothetical protein